MLICGSSTLGRLFDFISAHFWFNRALYFSLKNLFFGQSWFLIDFCSYFTDEVFFRGKK